MQATQHNTSLASNGQPINDNRIGSLITTRQALVIAFAACNSVLTGQPHPATFDQDDLRQSLVILCQMASTIEATAEGAL